MNSSSDIFLLPGNVLRNVAQREKTLRKSRGISQEQLAKNAGVSLGSLRRFEQTGHIAFDSLVAIAFALGCESDIEGLFQAPAYTSIEEVIERARETR